VRVLGGQGERSRIRGVPGKDIKSVKGHVSVLRPVSDRDAIPRSTGRNRRVDQAMPDAEVPASGHPSDMGGQPSHPEEDASSEGSSDGATGRDVLDYPYPNLEYLEYVILPLFTYITRYHD